MNRTFNLFVSCLAYTSPQSRFLQSMSDVAKHITHNTLLSVRCQQSSRLGLTFNHSISVLFKPVIPVFWSHKWEQSSPHWTIYYLCILAEHIEGRTQDLTHDRLKLQLKRHETLTDINKTLNLKTEGGCFREKISYVVVTACLDSLSSIKHQWEMNLGITLTTAQWETLQKTQQLYPNINKIPSGPWPEPYHEVNLFPKWIMG